MFDKAAQMAHRAAGSFERPQLTMTMEGVASDHRRIGAVAVRVAHRELQSVAADTSKTPHERYLAIYKLIHRRDKELARAFDDLRRSTALTQLAIIVSYGVVTQEELELFTPETREILAFLSNARA